ncbi:hypothetical protein SHO565_64690 [Streptomyces sp. HO565]
MTEEARDATGDAPGGRRAAGRAVGAVEGGGGPRAHRRPPPGPRAPPPPPPPPPRLDGVERGGGRLMPASVSAAVHSPVKVAARRRPLRRASWAGVRASLVSGSNCSFHRGMTSALGPIMPANSW